MDGVHWMKRIENHANCIFFTINKSSNWSVTIKQHCLTKVTCASSCPTADGMDGVLWMKRVENHANCIIFTKNKSNNYPSSYQQNYLTKLTCASSFRFCPTADRMEGVLWIKLVRYYNDVIITVYILGGMYHYKIVYIWLIHFVPFFFSIFDTNKYIYCYCCCIYVVIAVVVVVVFSHKQIKELICIIIEIIY
jgi:hypothetical protein